MTEQCFDKLYKQLKKDVEKTAAGYLGYLRSMNIYTCHRLDDYMQEMWLAIWQLIEGLPDNIYLTVALRKACDNLHPGRLWTVENFWRTVKRGDYVSEIPINVEDFYIDREGKCYYFTSAVVIESFQNKLLFELELRKRLTTRQWSIYLKVKDNRDLTQKEKNRHQKRYVGWNQEELAKVYGIDQATISREIKVIKDKTKEVIEEGGFKINS